MWFVYLEPTLITRFSDETKESNSLMRHGNLWSSDSSLKIKFFLKRSSVNYNDITFSKYCGQQSANNPNVSILTKVCSNSELVHSRPTSTKFCQRLWWQMLDSDKGLSAL